MSWKRVGRFVSWLAELRLLYLAVGCVLAGIFLIWCFDATERSIRLTGLFLQVLGIGTVVWGISATRKQFGHPPVAELLDSWLRRCPLIRRSAHLQADGISMGISFAGGRLISVFAPNPDANLQERLKHIEQGLETIQKRIEDAERQFDRELSATNGQLVVEAQAREAADKEVLNALESSSTGGVHISAIGALWLFAGVVLSTSSQEMAASTSPRFQ